MCSFYFVEVEENLVTRIANEHSSSEKQIEGIDIEKQELLLELQEETLMNWSNELAKFVETKASQSIYQRIQMDKLVAIIGSTGTGKSVCAKNIALRLKNEYGYTIVSTRQPSDITQYFLPGTNQVFIIDDFIGKMPLMRLKQKSIWNPEICERFRLSASVCDLHTDELRLTLLERRTICEAYLEKSYINAINDEIIMMYPFLPSLCSIFSSKDVGSVENFFKIPVQFINEEKDHYKMKSPVRYISLAVLAIKQKVIKKSFLVENDHDDKLIKDLFWESASQVRPSKELIVSQLETLTDSYVKVDKGYFEFIHETMQDIVLYCIAKTFLKSVLENSKSNVIKRKVELACITCIKKEQTVPVIKVGSEYEDAYFSRLARDLSNEQFADVFENNQNAFPIFRQKFLAHLNKIRLGIHFKSDSKGPTVLHILSLLGYRDYVSYFMKLNKGMINQTDAKGNIPLHLASMNGHLDIV
ncbi:unnamed protein product [Mytilus coruscus]|uniref:Novel STAND NTPase 3 domain-containing protein n=1 Tax=Mytilus coruscus TaxID=42192 RepID=A0A6J8A3W9_MYTCO|nr:unnamed protein product [Mytilus coruscus]